jgi:hypothetical protein
MKESAAAILAPASPKQTQSLCLQGLARLQTRCILTRSLSAAPQMAQGVSIAGQLLHTCSCDWGWILQGYGRCEG